MCIFPTSDKKEKFYLEFSNWATLYILQGAGVGEGYPWLIIINGWIFFLLYVMVLFSVNRYTSIITSGTWLLIVNLKVMNLRFCSYECRDSSVCSDVQQTPFAFIYTESVTWLLTFHLALSCHFFGFANFSFSLDLSTVTFQLNCDLINSEISYM